MPTWIQGGTTMDLILGNVLVYFLLADVINTFHSYLNFSYNRNSNFSIELVLMGFLK